MTASCDEFLNHLQASRLMSADEARSFLSSLPEDDAPADAEELARLLVKHDKLTPFQARVIYHGRGGSLVLGDYQILDQIGKGGMGRVYKARHHRMDRLVALKVLPARLVSSPDVIQRFQREMKAAAKLTHRNIATAYDARADGGVYYLVMEFVDGINLFNLVANDGALSPEQAVDYILQAAAGLQHAHSQGVIHRDIKPSNMLLDKQGTIKILDMGLARLHDEPAATIDAAAELTRVGRIMGTVDFMSPEQTLDTHNADELSDIYSLGCTLFFLLNQRFLYPGDSVLDRVMAHRKAPIPSLRKLRADVPRFVDKAFQRMVAKDRRNRFQSMREVIAALKNSPETASVGPPKKQSKELLPQHVLSVILAE